MSETPPVGTIEERVARALYAAEGLMTHAGPFEKQSADLLAYWYASARAAIEAMCEPTIEMLDAAAAGLRAISAAEQMKLHLASGKDRQRYKMLIRWRAMIDAALSPKQAG